MRWFPTRMEGCYMDHIHIALEAFLLTVCIIFFIACSVGLGTIVRKRDFPLPSELTVLIAMWFVSAIGIIRASFAFAVIIDTMGSRLP